MNCGESVHEVLWKFGYGICYFCRADISQPVEKPPDVCFSCGSDLLHTLEFTVCTNCGEISYELIYPRSWVKKSVYTPEKVWLPAVFARINREFDLPLSSSMQTLIVSVINRIRSDEILMKGKKRLSGYLNICAHLLFEAGVDIKKTKMEKYYLHRKQKTFWKSVMKTSVGDYIREETDRMARNDINILLKELF